MLSLERCLKKLDKTNFLLLSMSHNDVKYYQAYIYCTYTHTFIF